MMGSRAGSRHRGPSAPAQAVAAGFTNLVFNDDFTSASTVTLTNSTSPRTYKWYPASWGGTLSSTNVQVNPTWGAADSNMQAQGVSPTSATLNNASASGGIVRLQGGASNATLMTVDGYVTATPTTGIFQHGYFECYIQFRPGDVTQANSVYGWPGIWSWSMEAMAGLGYGGSPFNSSTYTELDFFEYAIASNGLAWGGGAYHGSMNGGAYGITTTGVTLDNNWHTIGCLWTTTTVQYYYDNAAVGPSATPSTALETEHQFMMIGSGLTVTAPFAVPIYVDWFRVWQ